MGCPQSGDHPALRDPGGWPFRHFKVELLRLLCPQPPWLSGRGKRPWLGWNLITGPHSLPEGLGAIPGPTGEERMDSRTVPAAEQAPPPRLPAVQTQEMPGGAGTPWQGQGCCEDQCPRLLMCQEWTLGGRSLRSRAWMEALERLPTMGPSR